MKGHRSCSGNNLAVVLGEPAGFIRVLVPCSLSPVDAHRAAANKGTLSTFYLNANRLRLEMVEAFRQRLSSVWFKQKLLKFKRSSVFSQRSRLRPVGAAQRTHLAKSEGSCHLSVFIMKIQRADSNKAQIKSLYLTKTRWVKSSDWA